MSQKLEFIRKYAFSQMCMCKDFTVQYSTFQHFFTFITYLTKLTKKCAERFRDFNIQVRICNLLRRRRENLCFHNILILRVNIDSWKNHLSHAEEKHTASLALKEGII